MKIVLQSEDVFNEVAILNTQSGEFSKFFKVDRQDLTEMPINGLFCYVDNRLICFFLQNQKLGLKIDNELIEIDDDDKILLEMENETQNLFRIQRGEKIVFSLIYNRPIIDPPLGAYQMFSMVDEEDFDFLLLIYNVCNDPDRKKRIFRVKTR